jgi:hypothetical protein
VKRLAAAAPLVVLLLLTVHARAEERPLDAPRDFHTAASPVLVGASFELVLGGRLATLPLPLYGLGLEFGGRLRAPAGIVFAPYFALHFLRGNTPAGLLYTSRSAGGGLDVVVDALPYLHYSIELGSAQNRLYPATYHVEYKVTELTGQALVAMDVRLNPWFALHGGVGYRFIGAIDAAVLVVGGRL